MPSLQINTFYAEHPEYSWAIESFDTWNAKVYKTTDDSYPRLKDLREMLVQLLFMSVRGAELREKWNLWITCAINSYSMTHMIGYGYASIAWIRDHSFGKGERQLAYKQLWAFYEALQETHPKEALTMITYMIVRWTGDTTHRYGSWRDARDMCAFIYERTQNRRHPAIVDILTHMICRMPSNKTTKWFPREHTSPVYDTFVEEWFRHNGYTMSDTVRDKVCDMRLLTKGQRTHCRRRVRKDIQQFRADHARFCKEHPTSEALQVYVPPCYTFPGLFVKKVRLASLYPRRYTVSPDTINEQWSELKKYNTEPYRAFLDVSEHVTEAQLDHAIGLALYYTASTEHRNSIVVVGDVHKVVSLYGTIYEKIVQVLNVVRRLRGRHCNLYNAVKAYDGTCILFSTFQIPMDEQTMRTANPVYQNLMDVTNPEQKFIFWNVSEHASFPADSGTAKCLMASGYSVHELYMPSIVMGVELSQVCMTYSNLLMRLHSYRYLGFVNFATALF